MFIFPKSPFYFACVPVLAVWFLGFPLQKLLFHLKFLDSPNERSSHDKPIVRGGGTAIMFVVTVGMIEVGWSERDCVSEVLGLLAAGVAMVSLADDFRSISPAARFAVQALAAFGALWALAWRLRLEIVLDSSWTVPPWMGLSLGFLWIAGYTNAFNFMDGINGIAAGQAVVTAVGMAILGTMAGGSWFSPPILACLIIAGAALGFLPHNFPQARMFMGDVGSAPLGFLLASAALWISLQFGWWLLVPIFLLHANFVFDTAITLVRRVCRGERWYAPHREHFYQRLIRSGKSHAFVTGWEMALQLAALALLVQYPPAGFARRLIIISLVSALWLGFFVYAEVLFRSSQSEKPPITPSNQRNFG